MNFVTKIKNMIEKMCAIGLFVENRNKTNWSEDVSVSLSTKTSLQLVSCLHWHFTQKQTDEFQPILKNIPTCQLSLNGCLYTCIHIVASFHQLARIKQSIYCIKCALYQICTSLVRLSYTHFLSLTLPHPHRQLLFCFFSTIPRTTSISHWLNHYTTTLIPQHLYHWPFRTLSSGWGGFLPQA